MHRSPRIAGAGAKKWRGPIIDTEDDPVLVPLLAVPTGVDRIHVHVGVPVRHGGAAVYDRSAAAAAHEEGRAAIAGEDGGNPDGRHGRGCGRGFSFAFGGDCDDGGAGSQGGRHCAVRPAASW